MGIKKSLAIGAAALAFNTAEIHASNLAETTKNTKTDIDKNISYTPSKPKGNAIDLADALTLTQNQDKDKNKRNKNSEIDEKRLEQAKKEWSGYENIKDINFSEDFLYAEFIYKDEYKVKYEYNKKGGNDVISITSLQGDKMAYPFSFMNTLFKKNIIDHYVKEAPKKTSKKEPEKTVIDTTAQKKEMARHKELIMKRIELCIKFQDVIQKECKEKHRKLDTENDRPYIQSGAVYFCVEREEGKEVKKSKIKKDEEDDIMYMTLVEKKQTKLDENKKPILDEKKNPVYETILTSKLISSDKYIMAAKPEELKQKK